MAELELIWAVVVTIALGLLVFLIVSMRVKYNRDIREMENRIAKERKNNS